jgi:hypothetical protein
VEQRHVRYTLPSPQAREGSPRGLLREQRQEQIQGTDWGQDDQQMQPPQLGGTQCRTWAARRTEIPPLVDENIGNVRIQQVQQLVGTGLGQRVAHSGVAYRCEPHLSGLHSTARSCVPTRSTNLPYTETLNTFYEPTQAAESRKQYLARYLNSEIQRSSGMNLVAVIAATESGKINRDVSQALSTRLKTGDADIVGSFFKPELVTDGLLEQLFAQPVNSFYPSLGIKDMMSFAYLNS